MSIYIYTIVYFLFDRYSAVHQSINKILKFEDVSINKHKCHSHFKNASQYSDNNFEDSTLLTTSLVKPALNDFNINIDTKTPVQEIKLYKTISTYKSYQILDEEKILSQNIEEYP